MLVLLKIPLVYLCMVVWWAISTSSPTSSRRRPCASPTPQTETLRCTAARRRPGAVGRTVAAAAPARRTGPRRVRMRRAPRFVRELGRRDTRRPIEQAGDQLDQRRFSRTAATDQRHHSSRRNIERDVFQNVGRFRAAVFETDAAQFDSPFETSHRLQVRAVASLLRLLFENIVQPIQQHGGELHVVPDAERAQNSRVSQRGQRTKRDESTDAEVAGDDLRLRRPKEKSRSRSIRCFGGRCRRT